jgi:hypothetical protein
MPHEPEAREPAAEELTLRGKQTSLSLRPSTGAVTAVVVDGKDLLSGPDGMPGSITELLGAPHEIHPPWQARKEKKTVLLTLRWGPVRVEKRLTLPSEPAMLRIDYSFLNSGPLLVHRAFGLRLQWPAASELRWRVATAEGLRSGAASSRAELRYLRPDQPWCSIEVGSRRVAMLFPGGVLDAVEVRSGEGLFSLTPLVYTLGLNPGCEARMTGLVCFDAPHPERMAELYETHASQLCASYGRLIPARGDPDAVTTAPARLQRLPIGHNLRRRAEQLCSGRTKRMEWLERLGEGEVTVDDAAVAFEFTAGESD